ncbi:MAG: signal peptidase I [Ectothiorhodospira sp.]
MDLELALVLGTAVTGLIWLGYALWLRLRGRPQASEGESSGRAKEPWYVEYARSFFPVLLVVLLLRSFVAEPFRIPSGSMMPTLLVGDFILVNKFAYGLRLPVLHTRILETGRPGRGDVAVFRFPRRPDEDYIKRIVGLPGDRVAFRGERLYINDEAVNLEDLGRYEGDGAGEVMTGARLMEERLGDARHRILKWPDRPSPEGEVRVPEGQYFVLGDNRDNSNDSRFWGFVPEANLVGRAMVIWMNWDPVSHTVRLERLGDRIH